MAKKGLIKWGLKVLIISLYLAPEIANAGDSHEVVSDKPIVGIQQMRTSAMPFTTNSQETLVDAIFQKFTGYNHNDEFNPCVKSQLFDISCCPILFQTFSNIDMKLDSTFNITNDLAAGLGRIPDPPDSSELRLHK